MVRNKAPSLISMSWPQFTWGVAMLILVLASWYDNRTQVALAITRIDARVASIEKTIKDQDVYTKAEIDLMIQRADDSHASMQADILTLYRRVFGRDR